MSEDECQKDGHGNCQHVNFDSENERWIIPSGTHVFMWRTVYGDSFSDYLATDLPELEVQQADDPAGELERIVSANRQNLNYVGTDINGNYFTVYHRKLLENLTIFISFRDRKIWDHAYRLGLNKHKRGKIAVGKQSKIRLRRSKS